MASDRPANDSLDQSLLDRLNALKSTSVTLDTTSNKLGPLNPASTTTNDTAPVKPSSAIGSAPSVSKDDALTERLRVLRNASSTSVPSSASRGSGQAPTASPKPEPDARRKGHYSAQPLPKRGQQTLVSRNSNQKSSQDEDTKTQIQTQILSSAWGLEEVDDQALDELLEGLQDDLNLQEDVPAEEEDEEEDIDLHAIANNNNYDDDDDGIIENDEQKVQKLLSELAPKPNNNPLADDHHNDDDTSDDDDNSDGEAMTKETNRILNQVQDEINLSGRRPTDDDNDDDDPFSLPSPPSGTRTPTFTTTSPKSPLTLPTVPSSSSTLFPSPASGSNQVIDDIPSLTARLSHLRSTPIKTDAFGLPSVPTTTLILPADSSFQFPPPPPPASLSSTKYQTKSTRGWKDTWTLEIVNPGCYVTCSIYSDERERGGDKK
ncbi:hypothetical protein GE21DRAFT_1312253 [Neurospora crassa]|nr:hypothetical protein GE21DRAFT_1312253 [Neurospora crassa]